MLSGPGQAGDEYGLSQLVKQLYTQPDFNLQHSAAAMSLLKRLNSGEIKLVRNAILARHQYRFKSHLLEQYFTNHFKDYKPNTQQVTLTAQDEENVSVIKTVEQDIHNYENSEAGLRAQMVGVWIPGPAIGGGAMPQNYTFKGDGTFIFDIGEGGCDIRIATSSGTWIINKNVLTLTTTHEKRYIGGKLKPVTDPVGCLSDNELAGGKWQTVQLKAADVKRYTKLRFVYEDYFGEGDFKPRFKMDKGEWWLYSKSTTNN